MANRPNRPEHVDLFGDSPPPRKRRKKTSSSGDGAVAGPPAAVSGEDCSVVPAFDSAASLKKAVSTVKRRRGKTHSVDITTYSDGSKEVGSAISDADTSAADGNVKRGSSPAEAPLADGSLVASFYGSVYSQRGTRG